jgi:hypothetical protein
VAGQEGQGGTGQTAQAGKIKEGICTDTKSCIKHISATTANDTQMQLPITNDGVATTGAKCGLSEFEKPMCLITVKCYQTL